MIDFSDQVAIVTGAGRGLGRHYALDLARRGAKVLVNDLGCAMDGNGSDTDVADHVVDEIRKSGGSAEASYDSVATESGGAAVVRATLDHFGRVDVVINNAGIVEFMPFEDIPQANWRRMIGTHLHGAFNVSQPAYKIMRDQGYGRFVFISSSAGAFGMPYGTHYGAAKAGVLGLMHTLALEGQDHGILANAVLPFATTRMAGTAEEGSLLALSPPELVVPLVTFLASRECKVSHHSYSACAGRYARVFLGVAKGWLATQGDELPDAEDVMAHFNDVDQAHPFTIPGSIVNEMEAVAERLEVGL